MTWLVNNWTLLVVIGAVVGVGAHYVKKFSSLPSDTQLMKVKEWLLYAVMIVEKEYSHGTGQLKLRAAYSMFIDKFPSLVTVISFDLFSKFVDEALVEMRKILETNKDIDAYINGYD